MGVFVEPGGANEAEAMGLGETITGSTDQIIETLSGFADVGVTRVEIVPYPNTMGTLERLAPVVAALNRERS